MRVGGYSDWYYSLFMCNFSGMPTTATKVVLRLYSYTSNGGSHVAMYGDRITSSWSNSTKWQGMPGMINFTSIPAPTDNQWVEIDITTLYNAWQNDTFPNYGIMLRPVSNWNAFNFFRSTEYSDAAYRPQIVITTGSFNALSTIVPSSTGVQVYQGIVQDSSGQVQKPSCSVTVTPSTSHFSKSYGSKFCMCM